MEQHSQEEEEDSEERGPASCYGKSVSVLVADSEGLVEDIHWLPRLVGIATTRTVLSGLPETRRFDAGLKRREVGGNSWALRIVSSG